MHRVKGFSLLELLIVIAIILVIAAIAIPSLLRAKMAANEASAVSSVRQIKTAETSYYTSYPSIGFATKIADLGGVACAPPTPASACLLDNVLSTAIPGSAGKSGYFVNATGIANNGLNSDFVASAAPISPRTSGDRDFCSSSDAVLRFEAATGAPPVTTVAACNAFPSILQ